MRVWARDTERTRVSLLAVAQFVLLLLVPPAVALLAFDLSWWSLLLVFFGAAVVASAAQLITRTLHAERTTPRVYVELDAYQVRVGGGRPDVVIDLKRPHRARLVGDSHDSSLQLVSVDGDITLSMSGVGRGLFAARFAEPRFVATGRPGAGIELDLRDTEHAQLLDRLLTSIWTYRQQNLRYQIFSSLPWGNELADARLNREMRPIGTGRSGDPVDSRVELWLDDRIGVSSDDLVVRDGPQLRIFPLASLQASRVADAPYRIALSGHDAEGRAAPSELELDSDRVTSDHVECLIQFVNGRR